MALSLSKKSSLIAQSEIRAMTIACAKIGGINLAQGVCDTEVPLPVRQGVQKGMDTGFNSYTRFDGLADVSRLPGETGKEKARRVLPVCLERLSSMALTAAT